MPKKHWNLLQITKITISTHKWFSPSMLRKARDDKGEEVAWYSIHMPPVSTYQVVENLYSLFVHFIHFLRITSWLQCYGSHMEVTLNLNQLEMCKSSLHDLHLKGMWLIKNLGTHRLLCNALPFLTTTTYSQSSSGAYHAGVPWAATANSTPIWLKLSRKIIWANLHLPKPDIGNHKAGRRF